MIALVQRPRRKVHLAALSGAEWLSLCDRVVLPVTGTTAQLPQDVVGTIDDRADDICADCWRLIVFAGYVGRDRVAAYLASLVRAA